MTALQKTRRVCVSFAVLSSWCHSLGTRRVCIALDSFEQLSLLTFLLTEDTPFANVFELIMDVLHAKLDRGAIVGANEKYCNETRTEACLSVRLSDGETLSCVQPLAYKFAHDTEQQQCHAQECSHMQPKVKLKLCLRCHGAKYCSSPCQRADWVVTRPGYTGHRDVCNRLAAGGRWHPDTPGTIPAVIAARYPGIF